MRLDISETGEVTHAAAVRPWRLPFIEIEETFVAIDAETGDQLPAPPPETDDLEVRELAARVARLQRYKPARRRGKPVAVRRYRTMISFG
jgi:hypothetical protein